MIFGFGHSGNCHGSAHGGAQSFDFLLEAIPNYRRIGVVSRAVHPVKFVSGPICSGRELEMEP
jgi:hypothetical protein